MNGQQKLWAKHAAEQLANVQNEHGIPTPRSWHMAAGYTPSPEMIEFAALIKEQMKAMPDIRLTLSKPNTVTGRLSQAAQFDGPMNSLIASYARRAIMLDYSYAEYVQYAQAYSKVAVISEPEYSHAKRHEVMHAWREAVNSSNLTKGVDDSFFKALAQGVAVMEVSVDEQDNILLKHWDANMIYKDAPVQNHLFNQRNHTE